MIPADKSKANASPTKAFFVRMITRDITLEDCIFDLIDNSIDGAWQSAGGHPLSLDDQTDLSSYEVRIQIEEDRFEIADNCGGITLDDAAEYAFTFGRKDDAGTENFSIGVYGIGMKRAIFKLGSDINIRSTYETGGDLESFCVPINVYSWLASTDENWDFDIEESTDLDQAGVQISVTQLTDSASRAFASPRFIKNLRRKIARDYALYLNRGLIIEVQGQPVSGWDIELRQGGDFHPMRAKFEEELEGERVFVEILAGMAAAPPDDSEPNLDFDEDQNHSGWYVVCNGRIVLSADKTTLTGWGTEGWPQWHPQYTGFIGIIIFSSRRADLLPLTTTKRSVDETSAIYRQYRAQMRATTKEWIAYTYVRKQTREEVIEKEKSAIAVPISEIEIRKNVQLPKITSQPKTPEANILYAVSRARCKSLASAFGDINMTYKDVGLKSFEYAFDELVGDD